MDTWTVATDGSALGNPGPGGWGWVSSEGFWGGGNALLATNNQMELHAILDLLQHAPSDVSLIIQADSRYAIDCLTKWVWGWRKKGWKTASGEPVKNKDLVEAIMKELARRRNKPTFEWVKGHNGHKLNELADTTARTFAEKAKRGDISQGHGQRSAP